MGPVEDYPSRNGLNKASATPSTGTLTFTQARSLAAGASSETAWALAQEQAAQKTPRPQEAAANTVPRKACQDEESPCEQNGFAEFPGDAKEIGETKPVDSGTSECDEDDHDASDLEDEDPEHPSDHCSNPDCCDPALRY
ncbi:Hypothetical protein SMAX5B_001406 [Scophthalmus maximus]|uniref:Uncharacterized protein n=1 Tax=Scophthalmus maximus TaxID=52904 RepID=A0A2U9CP51_SCOMX|nr:Hypothetical protein SMAX5B_001406 [Scophthalmus maximus]KAF0022098.1 hypothetical protein F2P81_025650 [Scophthalmus maximus]